MRARAIEFLRCPICAEPLALAPEDSRPSGQDADVRASVLRCRGSHSFPVVRGIPRMFPDALDDFGLNGSKIGLSADAGIPYDRRTREHFSLQWQQHEPGARTWGIDLDTRVARYFLESVRLTSEELKGKRLLDAGCGNGSQSVAYTSYGLDVFALDLSTGLEHGERLQRLTAGARAPEVTFVQGDLRWAPFASTTFDIIHSAGVLHHTPDPRDTFRVLCRLLAPGGTFYVWVYKYEPVVTPVVNAIRWATARLPAQLNSRLARVAAIPFQLFTRLLTVLGIRSYARLSRREAALALMDIFGSPHAHYYSYEELSEWFRQEGFEEFWPCNDDRRGFGICGRRPRRA